MSTTIIETINPATGKVIAKYQNMTDDQIREKVSDARSRSTRLEKPGYR